MDEMIHSFTVYEEKEEIGTAEVTLPDIEFISEELSGAGIAGNIETVALGLINAMTMTFNFKTLSNSALKLHEPRAHHLELRAAQQKRDKSTRAVSMIPVKHVVVVTPKKLGLGKLAMAASGDLSGEYAVSYLKTFIDGKTIMELDPANFKCNINGTDWLASVRNALGKN